ncbi:MAG: DUF3445 domain-containing protein [Sneathiella sp.]|nr:DUF3445 domain-containing protein [Sneathiella sp.]
MRYFPVENGDFRFSMGLKPVRNRSWLDTDDHYASDIKLKTELLERYKDAVFAENPHTEAAAEDILQIVTEELAAAHPHVTPPPCEEGNPLLKAALMVQEDLVLMQQGEGGGYDLTAASVSFPTGWNLSEKIGRPMWEIHNPVPDLNPAIGNSIDKFFQNMKPGKIVERFNWGLYDDDALFQPNWWRDQQPKKPEITLETIGEKFFFRIERQTLQRLKTPDSALFTIRIFNTPLGEVVQDLARKETLLRSLSTMPDAMRRYKTVARYEDLLFRYLKQA